MKTSMTYPIRFWALVLSGLLLYQFSSEALADSCKYGKDIDLTLDLSDSSTLSIYAVAGDLNVVGVSGSDQAVISGKACASKEAWLEESSVNTNGGSHAVIEVELPSSDKGWSFTGNNYVWMDLRVEVPNHLALEIKDSSGDMFLKNIAAVEVKDSSGDIEIEAARGPISISDSSGDIDIDKAEGDLTIESDSSGDINANNIHGSVLVVKDSSGDIDVSDVSDNVVVEKDSSGDIRATHVGGDFRVLKDGSGSISSSDVSGEVQIPKKS
jgi:DUF4097 and DUF4098 domain-containing protein YvlB